MSKHTKGPWIAIIGRHNIRVIGSDNAQVCQQPAGTHEDKANARLIAASPDLLEALKAIVSNYRIPDNVDAETWATQYNNAKDAIAKAEGD